MQEFAHAVTLSDADHEAKLKENLGALESISRSGDLDGIRAGIQGVTHSISESIDVMQRSHQAAVAQLRDEIRVLHEEVDRARSAEWTNAATGFWNRRKLDARIAELIATDRPFCLMLVRVRNLPQIAAQHPKALVNVCVKSLLQRFRGIVGSEALTGHWDESSFAAVLEIAASVALDLSGAAAQRLSGTYTVQEKGVSHNIALLAVAGVIERPTGIDEATYQRKLRQMLETLAWG